MEVRRRPWAMGFVACSSAVLLSSNILGCSGGTEPTTSNSTPITEQIAVSSDSNSAKNDVVLEDLEVNNTPAFGASALSTTATAAADVAPSALVNGGPQAHVKGAFEAVHNWPIMPIAVMLLTDGRVFAYGTNQTGAQGAKMFYSIWNPTNGTGPNAFTTLPNTTQTDIFCAGQAFLPDGRALIVGGDRTLPGAGRNYAASDVNVFNPTNNSLVRSNQNMNFRRWYATAVLMPNGTHVVMGGRDDKTYTGDQAPPTVETYAPTPEIRLGNGSWQPLTTATSHIAYGNGTTQPWFYPRAWLTAQGKIFIVGHDGKTFTLNPAGTGTLTKHALVVKGGKTNYPAVMFKQDQILSIRNGRQAVVIDLNNPNAPTTTNAGLLAYDRQQGSLTVLADGTVFASGGSSLNNNLGSVVAYESELWNPTTQIWTKAAKAAKPRLYHSSALLLPDGRVFTGGGGAPKPLSRMDSDGNIIEEGVNNLDGQIYYPPYLFEKDGSGTLAPRPEITVAPQTAVTWDRNIVIEADEVIKRVTLVRAGAATHTFDNEARFFDLPVPTPSTRVTVRTPLKANIAPPGYYMLFVWNEEGVPSEAKMIRIAAL